MNMTGDRWVYWVFGTILLAYIGYEILRPKPVDWSPSYTKEHTIPYGAHILFEELDVLFPGQPIESVDVPLFRFLRSVADDTVTGENRNWLFMDQTLRFDPLELDRLLALAARGDHLFMAAERFEGALTDTLQLKRGTHFSQLWAQQQNDRSRTSNLDPDSRIPANFTNAALQRSEPWEFNGRVAYHFIFDRDSLLHPVTELGVVAEDRVNFIRVPWGEGMIYLHHYPQAFTNVNLLDQDRAAYAFRALSYLPEQPVVWDNSKKAIRGLARTPMAFIFGDDALRSAWQLLLTGVVLLMIFKGRREQRAVPVRTPPANSTVDFVTTIASLYLESNSNRDMALKKRSLFYDYLRTRLQIDPASRDALQKTAERSGCSADEVQELFALLQQLDHSPSVSDDELKTLTEKVDLFYKQSLR
ncbi:MAG: DUF4350 domain-containing protein [Balneolaceae bacterium]